jgi:O-antigen/teichoic acid export membrane protein
MTIGLKTTYELGQRTVAGGVWLSASRLTQQGVSLIQITILARLLDPRAFGLVGLANLATTAIGVFVYTGFEFALIQKPDLQEADIHTAWWVVLGRYLAIGGGLALLANPIAHLYQTPEAVPVLIAYALIQPIQGFVSPSTTLFRRNMQFRKVFALEAGSALAGLIVGVMAAIVLRNVWALVLAYLATTVSLLLLSYALHPYRPRWYFSRDSFKEFSHYGQWILGSAILTFVYSQGSSAFSGWMFGVAALGLYQMAARFALLPSTQLSDVIQSALMPAYSLIQEDKDWVSRAFLKALGLTAMLIMGMTALFALGLPRLLILLLGDRWIQAVSLVPAIAIAGGAQAMLRTGSPLYLGTGHPRFQFLSDLVQAVVTALLLYPLGRLYGLVGLPFAVLGGVLCALPVWWLGVRQSTTCTLRDVISVFLPATLGVGMMTIVFSIGQIPAISHPDSPVGIIWHVVLISVAGLGFLVTIGICQRMTPHYSPLTELQSIVKQWPHLPSKLVFDRHLAGVEPPPEGGQHV